MGECIKTAGEIAVITILERGSAVLNTILDYSQEPDYRHLRRIVMTYKLNPQLNLIKAPVILVTEGIESSYGSGEDLTTLEFDKNYIVESVSARDGSVVITLKENNRQFNINWVGEEAVSFI